MGRYTYGRKNIVIWVCSSVGNSSDQKDGGCDVPLRYVRANVRGSAYWAVVLWPKLGTTEFKIPIFFGVILFRCAAGSTGPYSSPFHFGMSALACDGVAPERRTRQKR